MGYTVGPNLVYRLGKKAELETGLLFSNKVFGSKKHKATYYSQWANGGFNANAPIPPGLPSHLRSSYSNSSIDVPLKANFNFGVKRLRWCVGSGIAANILVGWKSRLKVWYEDGSTKTYSNVGFDYYGIRLSPQVSAGVNYQISERLYVKAEPTLRYSLVSFNDSPANLNLWNGGLNVALFLNTK